MKLQALTQIMGQFINPLMPMMQQQGLAIDVRTLVGMLGEFTQMPDIGQLVVDSKQGQPVQSEKDQAANKNVNKRTESVRINKPGATQQGQDQMMSRLLLSGKGVQESEAASIMRPSE
jgi:hypothetical protein